VSLVKGQGGTPVDEDLGATANTWRVVEYAHEAGLVLAAVVPFEPPQEYRCVGRRGRDASFWLGGSLTHVFVKSGASKLSWGILSLYPPSYTFDLSFWLIDEAAFDEAEVLRIVRSAARKWEVQMGCFDHATLDARARTEDGDENNESIKSSDGGSGDEGSGRFQQCTKDCRSALVESAEVVSRSRDTPRDASVATVELTSLVLRVTYRPPEQLPLLPSVDSTCPDQPLSPSSLSVMMPGPLQPPVALSRHDALAVHETIRLALVNSYAPIAMRTKPSRPSKN